jgi:sugar lactone lactonase YvrE
MTRTWIAIALVVAACSSNGSGGGDQPDGGGGDGAGGDGGARTPFTTGVSTLAGDALAGYLDGSRDVNLFHNPVNLAYGPDGKVYVADFDNDKLRAVDAAGTATTVIDQPGFQRPFGMAFAPDGALWVSTDNDPNGGHTLMSGTIWKVDVAAHTAMPVAVAIGRPRSLAVLADGRLAAADDLHHVIELVDPHTGTATILAGAWDAPGAVDAIGAFARFSSPYGLVQRGDGKLVVCDFDNHRLRVVGLDGTVTTLAGSVAGFADGAMTGAKFDHPQGLAIAANGDLFITDIDNFRVRRIASGGTTIETIAGDGTAGYLDSDDRLGSELYGLEGISVKPDGSMVYAADGTRGEDVPFNRIRQIQL